MLPCQHFLSIAPVVACWFLTLRSYRALEISHRHRDQTVIATTSKVFFSADELRRVTGLSRTTVWRLETEGDFPPRRQITTKRVGWLVSEVEEWAESRPLAQPDPEMGERARGDAE